VMWMYECWRWHRKYVVIHLFFTRSTSDRWNIGSRIARRQIFMSKSERGEDDDVSVYDRFGFRGCIEGADASHYGGHNNPWVWREVS
jgi:IS1 family transposase